VRGEVKATTILFMISMLDYTLFPIVGASSERRQLH